MYTLIRPDSSLFSTKSDLNVFCFSLVLFAVDSVRVWISVSSSEYCAICGSIRKLELSLTCWVCCKKIQEKFAWQCDEARFFWLLLLSMRSGRSSQWYSCQTWNPQSKLDVALVDDAKALERSQELTWENIVLGYATFVFSYNKLMILS